MDCLVFNNVLLLRGLDKVYYYYYYYHHHHHHHYYYYCCCCCCIIIQSIGIYQDNNVFLKDTL